MHWMCIDTGMVFVLIDTFAGGRTTYSTLFPCGGQMHANRIASVGG